MPSSIITVEPKPNPSSNYLPFKIDITVEGAVLVAAGTVAFWQVFIKPNLMRLIEKATRQSRQAVDLDIQKSLAELVGITGACRAVLYEFHNGGKLASGRHFERVSITNQYCRPGYAPIGLTDAPISILSKTVSLLENSSTGSLVNEVTACAQTDLKCQILVGFGVTHTIDFMISKTDGQRIGVLDIHFDDASQIGQTEWLGAKVKNCNVLVYRLSYLLEEIGRSRSVVQELYKLVRRPG
jgi:hypothetical protein